MKIDFIYGTAWKEELTEACVLTALKVGFRAIDSANQRKHYYEEGVGHALKKAFSTLGLSRKDLFLQSKFTFARGQDHRMPYDENAPIGEQVHQSFESSLKNLNVSYLDSYLLHGPSTPEGLTDTDWEAWSSMEELYEAEKVRVIGISNVSAEQVAQLYEGAVIKPSFVQNRCLALSRWDQDVRRVCNEMGITYQGFSLLSNNWKYLGGEVVHPENRNIPQLVFEDNHESSHALHPEVDRILKQTGMSIQQVVFRFAKQLGILPLVGSRSEEHLKLDLNLGDINLSDSQLEVLENIAFLN